MPISLRILAFASAADQLGTRERVIECLATDLPSQIVERLGLCCDERVMRVAVDGEYHPWDLPVGEAEELALIPPVCGG